MYPNNVNPASLRKSNPTPRGYDRECPPCFPAADDRRGALVVVEAAVVVVVAVLVVVVVGAAPPPPPPPEGPPVAPPPPPPPLPLPLPLPTEAGGAIAAPPLWKGPVGAMVASLLPLLVVVVGLLCCLRRMTAMKKIMATLPPKESRDACPWTGIPQIEIIVCSTCGLTAVVCICFDCCKHTKPSYTVRLDCHDVHEFLLLRIMSFYFYVPVFRGETSSKTPS